MKAIDDENIVLNGQFSPWKTNKVQKQRNAREEKLVNEIKEKFGFVIDLNKEKNIFSEHNKSRGSDHAPVEGDLGFPSWLRIKYRKLKEEGNDDLIITYS